jgi:hypothetical protein
MQKKPSCLNVIAAACALALLHLGGCASTTEGGAVGANRSQLMLVSSEQLDQAAAQGYAQLRADAQSKGQLNTNN